MKAVPAIVLREPQAAPTPKRRQHRVIYFLDSPSHNLIKIGVASNLDQRLAQLRGGSPVDLTLLGTIDCFNHGALELELHRQFDQLRMRGEWFHGHKDLRDYIADHATAPVVDGVDPLGRPDDAIIGRFTSFEGDPPLVGGIKMAYFFAASHFRGPSVPDVDRALEAMDDAGELEALRDTEDYIVRDAVWARAKTYRPATGWPRRGDGLPL